MGGHSISVTAPRRAGLATLALASALALGACEGRGGGTPGADSPAAQAGADTADAAGMPGMGGMHGGAVEQMRSHLRMMEGASGDSLKAMLPTHRQMAANMVAAMNREMTGMGMTGDARWTATIDSVRQDLRALPEMGAAELRDFMPAHRGRLARLLEMHEEMMKGMRR